MSDVTRILQSISKGDATAAEELLPIVYDELRRLASRQMAKESSGHTLQATALVHEAYLRLAGAEVEGWENRRHFFGAAAEAMRRILVDHARRKKRLRHGGDRKRVGLDGVDVPAPEPREEVVQVGEALDELAKEEPTVAELIKLRYFAGLTQGQTAELLGLARRTADRYWAYGRAWLHDWIQGQNR